MMQGDDRDGGYDLHVWRRKTDAAYAATVSGMNEHLYGDDQGFIGRPAKLSWRQWFALKMQRVRDAWDVLCGRADIG